MQARSRGFTLIELVTVVAVIAILATITILGMSRYQANSRDASREAKAAVVTEALEKYYDTHGEYPSCAQLTQDPNLVSKDVLTGIDVAALKTPNGNDNSIVCSDLTNVTQGDYFAYVGDSSDACVGSLGSACVLYRFKYGKELTSSIATINSRRQTNISSSSVPVLSTSGLNYTQVTVAWPAVPDATSYVLQYATSIAGFPAQPTPDSGTATAGTVTLSGSTTSRTITGLAPGTQYYFRAYAANAASVSAWSGTKTATTPAVIAPTLTPTTYNFSQINVSWPAVASATSIVLQYATSPSGFPAQVSPDSTSATAGTMTLAGTATTKAVTGLSTGTQYYFRARTVVGSYISAWSSNSTATTWDQTPPTITSTAPSATSVQFSWNATVGVSSYSYQTRINGSYGGAWSGTSSTTNRTVTVNANQGDQVELRLLVYYSDGSNGGWIGPSSRTLSVTTPAWNAWGRSSSYPYIYTWVYNTGGAALCPAGTSIYTQFRDGIYGSYWNGWGGFSSNGGSSETVHYTSSVASYSATLQTEINGYCRNNTSGTTSSTVSSGQSTYTHPTPPGATLSGPVSCSGAYNIRPTFSVILVFQETSLNLEANTSVVTWTAYRQGYNTSYHTWNQQYDGDDYHSANIEGVTLYSGVSASARFKNTWSVNAIEALYNTNTANVDTADSGSLTIGHNPDGSRVISGSISDGFGGQVFGNASCSIPSYTLSDLR